MSGTSSGVQSGFHERFGWFVGGGGVGNSLEPLALTLFREGVGLVSDNSCRYQTLFLPQPKLLVHVLRVF